MRWQRLAGRNLYQGFGLSRFNHTSGVLQPVQELPSWDLQTFRDLAFNPAQPARLKRGNLPPSCNKWFIHDGHKDFDIKVPPKSSELRTEFWSEHESTMVPLELTLDDENTTFTRTHGPLKLLLTFLGNVSSPSSKPLQRHSIYLAQCDLESLPASMRSDLPTPDLVLSAGKGDIYSSSLWLGRPPTNTPLHRDPNPNLFLQLAGSKIVRLLPPTAGKALFEHIQEKIGVRGSASFRGEEMMQGVEKDLLDQAVWQQDKQYAQYSDYLFEAHLGIGEALFIPKGWWHSVKGVGQGITASANWWFR